MDEYYQPTSYKEKLVEKIKIFLAKEGPYILRSIIRFFVDIIVLLIKLIKHLIKTTFNIFTGREIE